MPTVSVIIPVLNEEDAIAKVIADIPQTVNRRGDHCPRNHRR